MRRPAGAPSQEAAGYDALLAEAEEEQRYYAAAAVQASVRGHNARKRPPPVDRIIRRDPISARVDRADERRAGGDQGAHRPRPQTAVRCRESLLSRGHKQSNSSIQTLFR